MYAHRLNSLENGTIGSSDAIFSARHRIVRFRRKLTLVSLAGILLAALGQACVRFFAFRAHSLAVKAGEQCWPLASSHVPALVLADSARTVLWMPTYLRDDDSGDLLRTRETSVFCKDLRIRIRQKHARVNYGMGRMRDFSNKEAVCIMHYVDYFKSGKC
jgi:hypothetical protein